MVSKLSATYQRPHAAVLARRLAEPRTLLVGGDGIPVEEFLLKPVEHWVKALE